jgi:hypothetical protein
MGWNFRRSMNLGPLRVNASQSGLGCSVGVSGFRIGKDAKGRGYTASSIPGTGIYRRDYLKKAAQQASLLPRAPGNQQTAKRSQNPAQRALTVAAINSRAWLLYIGGALLLYFIIRSLF